VAVFGVVGVGVIVAGWRWRNPIAIVDLIGRVVVLRRRIGRRLGVIASLRVARIDGCLRLAVILRLRLVRRRLLLGVIVVARRTRLWVFAFVAIRRRTRQPFGRGTPVGAQRIERLLRARSALFGKRIILPDQARQFRQRIASWIFRLGRI
jgi:hypothetical protein